MNAVQGESEKALDDPKEGLRTRKSEAKKRSDEDIESYPSWVY
jgi:hypothetical protein